MKNTFSEPPVARIETAIEIVRSRLSGGDFPNNKQLVRICADHGIGLADANGEPHLVHEILETAVNLFLSETAARPSHEAEDKYETLRRLEDLTLHLPTQTWRGGEQTKLQQFSTPPALGFLMAQILAPGAGKTALEPSAGTGNLAIWLRRAGCRTEVNEISPRRRMLLELQDFQPHAVNAEFLDDLLPAEIEPDYVLMNPPFSASLGRASARDSNFGFRHVEAALRRLKPGGNLVALLGADSSLKTDKGKTFWHCINREHRVQAFLVVPREVFYKYGTTFQTVVAVVTKPESDIQPTSSKPQICEFDNLTEMLRFIETFGTAI